MHHNLAYFNVNEHLKVKFYTFMTHTIVSNPFKKSIVNNNFESPTTVNFKTLKNK